MPVKATDKVFSLRLPIDVYERLKKHAKKNRHAVNSEILIAIDEHLEKVENQPPTLTSPSS